MIDTRPNLDNSKFEQCSGDVLNLSGTTYINGTLSVLSGSTLKIQDDAGDGKVLTSDASGNVTWQLPSESASGDKVVKEISQTSHGFSTGDFIGWSGGTYNKAIANGNYDGEFIGLVNEVSDVNTFYVTQAGYVTGLTSLVQNTTYWLSPTTAGNLTSTEPSTDGQIAKPVLIADSTTSGWVLPYAGFVVSSGATALSTAENGLTDNSGIVELGGTLCKNTEINADGNWFYMCCTSQLDLKSGSGAGSSYACIRLVPSGVNLYQSGGTGGIQLVRGVPLGTNQSFTISGDGMVIEDDCDSKGLVYDDDYSAVGGSDPRWIPDVAWVTGNTGGGCGAYSLSTPATCTVGGITAGDTLTGKTLECLLQEILAPYIVPTFSSFNISGSYPIEVGASLSGTKTFTWSTTTSGNVASNSIGVCEVGGSLLGSGLANDGSEVLNIGTKTNTSPTTWTWQITGCSTQDNDISRNVSKCSIYPYYWGVEPSGSRPPVTNDLVTGGTKVVGNSNSTVTVDFNSSNQYTWLAIPSTSISKTCWYVNALNNGNIGNPGDKYPDECLISISSGQGCWSSVNYKVYVSGFAATDSDPIQFRNS